MKIKAEHINEAIKFMKSLDRKKDVKILQTEIDLWIGADPTRKRSIEHVILKRKYL